MYLVSEEAAAKAVLMTAAIAAMEAVMRTFHQGEARVLPVVLAQGCDPQTRFSVKSGVIATGEIMGLKIGSYWPGNRQAGLKAHASTTMLLDAATGYPRALIAASHLTALRTAAIDAVAVDHLARAGSRTLCLVGAGNQAWFELLAIREVRPIERVLIWNRSIDTAQRFASRVRGELGLSAEAVQLRAGVEAADIVVTVTPSREPLVQRDWVRPGTHISAMGADGSGKQELAIDLVAASALFADVVAQSLTMGEFEAAANARLIDEDDITPLGAVLTGAAGRVSDKQITIFDSSGMALQDLAICSVALSEAIANGSAKTVWQSA